METPVNFPEPYYELVKILGPRFHLSDWYVFDVMLSDRPIGPRAVLDTTGVVIAWCFANITGRWSYKPDASFVTFFINDANEAMRFKLAWSNDFPKKTG